MKKLKFLMLFCLFSSMLFAAQKNSKTVKNEYDLKFNPDKYVSKETEINGQKIKYRAYENIVYVKNPVDKDYQNMNIYIPEEYFNNSSMEVTIVAMLLYFSLTLLEDICQEKLI